MHSAQGISDKKVSYGGEKPSTNKTTNTRTAGVPQGDDIAARDTVRYGRGVVRAVAISAG